MLFGTDLLAALAATMELVGVRSGNSYLNKDVSPEAAIRIVLRAPFRFEGQARTGRVYWIRATTGKPVERDPSHWDGRACLRFWADETNQLVKVRNKRLAMIYDMMVNDPPRYMVRKTV